MFEEELDKLLEQEWNSEEAAHVQKLVENLKYYKKMMTKSLKADLQMALQMCIRLKMELETLRKGGCTCQCGALGRTNVN
ncbi:hypothetical protein EB118_17365 [bacterium]|nr:hypothetical protein [bacterium]NDG31827.1 hypothetical protein [bacterium]